MIIKRKLSFNTHTGNPHRTNILIMKRIIFILFALFSLSFLSANASLSHDFGEQYQTSLKRERFEVVQSGQNYKFSLLLDKYTGNTWLFHTDNTNSGWKEIFRKGVPNNEKVRFRVADKGNDYNRYQVKVINGDTTIILLIDTETETAYELTLDEDNSYLFVLIK